MKKIVIASNNLGKLNEIGVILAPLDIEIVAQTSLGVSEAEEPYFTFVENALAKAYHASRATGLPALADDSGICVDALGGLPGVHSARFAVEPAAPDNPAGAAPAGAPRTRAAQDERNNRELLARLANETNRKAHYYCVIVLTRHPDDPRPLICEAEWSGEIVDTPRGTGGFGYDPLFMVEGTRKTCAEFTPEEKNRVSHRAQALAQLVARLRAELGIKVSGPGAPEAGFRTRSPEFRSEDEAVRSRILPSRFRTERKKP